MIEIKYTIQLYSDWHCGSGLGAGAETDAEVIKDVHNLPYVPGKTIKGLLKEACEEISEVQSSDITSQLVTSIFGNSDDKKESTAGAVFFANAVLPQEEQNEIKSNRLQEYLYRNIASTAITENGIAKQNSLRVIEVCIPINLEGKIEVENDAQVKAIKLAMQWVRHLGTNRNRGLGRCKFSIISKIDQQ